MIQAIRDKAQGIVIWVIVGVLILMFALWGIGNYLTAPAPAQRPVAEVNGKAITHGELQFAYQQAQRNVSANTTLTLKQQQALKALNLQNLINRELLYQNATKADLGIAKQQVDSLIAQFPSLQVNGQFSQQRLQLVLQNLGMDAVQFQQYLATNVVITQQQQGIVDSQFILPTEVDHYLALINQSRNFGYLVVDSSRYAKTSQVSQAAIQAYYNQHKQDYVTPAKVQLSYLELNYADVLQSIHINDQQALNYYQQNQPSFIHDGKPKPFASVKAEIIQQLQKSQAERQYAQLGNQMANITFENPASLQQAAQQLKLTVHTTGMFTSTTGHTGILADKAVLQAVFSDNVLKQRNNSNVINISPTQAVVVRVKQYTPATPKPLADVANQIRTTLAQTDATQAAAHEAQKLLVQIKQGANPAAVAKQYGFDWHTHTDVHRDDSVLDKNLLRAVFNTGMPGKQPVDIVTPLSNGDYAVVQITRANLTAGQNQSDPKAKLVKLALTELYRQRDYQNLVQSLRDQAKINIVSSGS